MYLCVFQVNNKSYYDELLDKVRNYVSPMQFDLFKLMLSVRTYSPAIEMSRQVRSALVVFFFVVVTFTSSLKFGVVVVIRSWPRTPRPPANVSHLSTSTARRAANWTTWKRCSRVPI